LGEVPNHSEALGGIGKGLGLYGHRNGLGRALFAIFSGSKEKCKGSVAFETPKTIKKGISVETLTKKIYIPTGYSVFYCK
jgi:hypothetical protein